MAARVRSSAPEFLTSPILGELIAAGLQSLADPPPGDHGFDGGQPAPTPTERAMRSMYNRAAEEIREHHRPSDTD